MDERCVTVNSKGEKEIRHFLSKGKFLMYNYIKDGKELQKYAIVLAREDGKIEELIIVPTKTGRELVVKHKFREDIPYACKDGEAMTI